MWGHYPPPPKKKKKLKTNQKPFGTHQVPFINPKMVKGN